MSSHASDTANGNRARSPQSILETASLGSPESRGEQPREQQAVLPRGRSYAGLFFTAQAQSPETVAGTDASGQRERAPARQQEASSSGLAAWLDTRTPDSNASAASAASRDSLFFRNHGGLDTDKPLPALHWDEPLPSPPPSEDGKAPEPEKPRPSQFSAGGGNMLRQTSSSIMADTFRAAAIAKAWLQNDSERNKIDKKNRRVHFAEDIGKRKLKKTELCLECFRKSLRMSLFFTYGLIEFWKEYVRKFVILISLYELWSVGIWIGFLEEPAMADTLLYLLFLDAVSNGIFLLDKVIASMEILVANNMFRHWVRHHKRRKRSRKRRISQAQKIADQTAQEHEMEALKTQNRSRLNSAGEDSGSEAGSSQRIGAVEKEAEATKRAQPESKAEKLGGDEDEDADNEGAQTDAERRKQLAREALGQQAQETTWEKIVGSKFLRVLLPQMVLGCSVIPIQLLLWNILRTQDYAPWLVTIIKVVMFLRVGGAARGCINFINQKELDVYVEIRIHGTTTGSNKWRVVAKQFAMLLFWGHWVGCLIFGLRVWTLGSVGSKVLGGTRGLPRTMDGARDYFQQFERMAEMAGYVAGVDLIENYALALYKGFQWNFEDLVPERPESLLLELLASAGLVAMRSYCIGSFFKYHQKMEDEMVRFNMLLEAVEGYMNLCELPPSLRKEILQHFRFQQEKRREAQTLEVLHMLPMEVQKKLKEHEYLPLVVGRNPTLFGSGLSQEFCMQIVMLLETRFMQPGEIIFVEGGAPRELVFLDLGSVALSRLAPVGQNGKTSETLMYYLRADRKEDPTVLGEHAFLLGHPHFYSARVRPGLDAVVQCMSKGLFEDQVVSVYPDQYDILIRNMGAAMLLDINGTELVNRDRNPEHDTEHFQALQGLVRRLLKQRRDYMHTAFTVASSTGDIRVVREMLAKRIDVNMTDYDKRSAMHAASSEGMLEALEVLLQSSANPNIKDRWNSTPLQDALAHGSLSAANLIHRWGGELEFDDPSGVLCTCASSGDITKMQQMLDFGVDVNAGDYDQRTALHLAAAEGRLTVVSYLTGRAADVNVKDRWGSTPLEDAIGAGYPIVARHLRNCGGRVNSEFAANMLCDAASTGNLQQLNMLIENGVNVNEGDYDLRCAMHLAAAEGQLLAIHYLIKVANADASCLDRWKGTPLQDALASGYELCAHFLLSQGAMLGPVAPQEMVDKVNALKKEWFKNEGKPFWEMAEALQKRITNHAQLVRDGRARSDIFDIEDTVKFNSQLIHSQIKGLGGLSQDAAKLASMLARLEDAGVEPMAQMLRVLEDGEALNTAVQFWQKLRAHSEKRHASANAKDVPSTVFDEVLFGTAQMGPRLFDAIERCADNVLMRVDALFRSRMVTPGEDFKRARMANQKAGEASVCGSARTLDTRSVRKRRGSLDFGSPNSKRDDDLDEEEDAPPQMPRLSDLLVEELFNALGWSSGSQLGGGHFSLLDRDVPIRQKKLAQRMEQLARTLLPVDYLSVSVQNGVLLERHCGEEARDWLHNRDSELQQKWTRPTEKHVPWTGDVHQKQTKWCRDADNGGVREAMAKLAECLRDGTTAVVDLEDTMPEVPKPKANPAAMQSVAYTALCPESLLEAPETQLVGKLDLQPSPELLQLGQRTFSESQMRGVWKPPMIATDNSQKRAENLTRRRLIAGELSLVTLTALVMEAWDKANKPGAQAQQRQPAPERNLVNGYNGYKSMSSTNSLATLAGAGGQKEVTKTPPETLDQLARIIMKAATHCEGEPMMGAKDRQHIHDRHRMQAAKAREQRIKEKRNGLKRLSASSEENTPAGKLSTSVGNSETSQDNEQQEIQMPKIQGLESSMEPENLAALLDFSDGKAGNGEKGATLFGSMSRERFALNVIRWVLGYDEKQRSIVDGTDEDSRDGELHHAGSSNVPTMTPGNSRDHDGLEGQIIVYKEVLSNGESVCMVSKDLDLFDAAQRSESSENEEFEEVPDIGFIRGGKPQHQGSVTLGTRSRSIEGGADKGLARTHSRVSIENTWGRMAALKSAVAAVIASFGREGRKRRRQAHLAKRFRELDEDGEGVGFVDVAKLLAAAFHYTISQEQEMRAAQRMFELLERDELGELILLQEFLDTLPTLENELAEEKRKRRHVSNENEFLVSWRVTKMISSFVIPPDTQWLSVWDSVKWLVAVYYTIEVPIRFCFVSMDRISGWQLVAQTTLNLACDIFMVLNVTLTFFRAFMHPTKGFITSFQEIRVHYLLNYFFFDCLACCPVDYVLPERINSLSYRGPLGRPRAALRLLRLLHMRHLLLSDNLRKVTKTEEQRERMTWGFFRTAWVLMRILLAIIHFVACIWWYLGVRFDSYNALGREVLDLATAERWSWTYGYDIRPGEAPLGEETGAAPFWWQYMIAFYWSTGRVTGGGATCGEMFPGSVWEVFWAGVLFLLSTAVGGYIDGVLAGKVITRDEEAIEARATTKIVEDFLTTVELPEQIAAQIHAQAGTKASRGDRYDYVSNQLPHTLKVRIARRAFLPYFEKTDVFKDCSDNFLCELGITCRVLAVEKDSLLAASGEPATRMLLLCRGKIAFVDTAGTVVARSNMPGELIGHMPLLFDLKHPLTCLTSEECKMIMVSRHDLLAACTMYPEDKMCVRQALLALLEGKGDDGEHSEHQSQHESHFRRAQSMALSSGTKQSGSKSASQYGGSHMSRRSNLIRQYGVDIQRLRERAQQEQVEAKQKKVCQLIDMAAKGDKERVVETMSKGELMIDDSDYDQRSPLHLAVCGGHLDMTRLLVERFGASLTVKDRFGHTPMDDAVRERQIEVARYLAECGAVYQVDADVACQLCAAACSADMETLQLLLEVVHVDPNAGDYDRRTALHLAASEGHLEIVQLLMDMPGVNHSPKDRLGNTPLDDAMRHRQLDVRKLLQDYGAEFGDAQVGVQLCTLGATNDSQRLRELGESGVSMDEGDYDARTGLHLAASEGNLEAATYLLNEAGVDPNPLDRFLMTPLDDAVRHGHLAIESLLLEFKAASGKDPVMKDKVEAFARKQQEERELKTVQKLEREVARTEVHCLRDGLKRFVDHPEFEEDMHSYVAHAATFRRILLQLVYQDMLSDARKKEEDALKGSVSTQNVQPDDRTKQLNEKLLEQAAMGTDAAAARLVAIFETELLPWLNGLPKAEAKILRLYVPGLKESVTRIAAHLKSRTKLSRATKKLWYENRSVGSYHCPAIGLISQKWMDNESRAVCEARLDALTMLWMAQSEAVEEQEAEAPSKSANVISRGSTKLLQAQKTQESLGNVKKASRDDASAKRRRLHGTAALRMILGAEVADGPEEDEQ